MKSADEALVAFASLFARFYFGDLAGCSTSQYLQFMSLSKARVNVHEIVVYTAEVHVWQMCQNGRVLWYGGRWECVERDPLHRLWPLFGWGLQEHKWGRRRLLGWLWLAFVPKDGWVSHSVITVIVSYPCVEEVSSVFFFFFLFYVSHPSFVRIPSHHYVDCR